MTLTQQQKALAENIIMLIEELTARAQHLKGQRLDDVLFYAFGRVKTILRLEKPEARHHLDHDLVLDIAEIVGKEIRKVRYYKDMTAEEIIEVLDIVFKILKSDEEGK